MTEDQSPTQSVMGDAGVPGRVDPDRIKYIMQSLEWPRGLYYAAFGLWFAIFGFGKTFWEDSPWEALWDLGSFVVPFFLWAIWIPRYYARRFGIFRPKTGPTPNPWTKTRSWLLILIFGSCYLLANILQRLSRSRIDLVGLVPPLLLLSVVLLDPWRKLRSAMEMTLMAIWGLILAFINVLPLWVPDNVQGQPLWKAVGATVAGITCMVFGLYDHITLTRLIPKLPAEDNHE